MGVAIHFNAANLNGPLPYHLTFDTFRFDTSNPSARVVTSYMKAVVTNSTALPPSFHCPRTVGATHTTLPIALARSLPPIELRPLLQLSPLL